MLQQHMWVWLSGLARRKPMMGLEGFVEVRVSPPEAARGSCSRRRRLGSCDEAGRPGDVPDVRESVLNMVLRARCIPSPASLCATHGGYASAAFELGNVAEEATTGAPRR